MTRETGISRLLQSLQRASSVSFSCGFGSEQEASFFQSLSIICSMSSCSSDSDQCRMKRHELNIPPPVVAPEINSQRRSVSGSGASLDLPHFRRIVGSVMIASSGGFIALAGKVAPNRAKTTFHPLRPENTASPVTSGIHCFSRNSKYTGLFTPHLAMGCLSFIGFGCSWPNSPNPLPRTISNHAQRTNSGSQVRGDLL